MKLNLHDEKPARGCEVIAQFGRAALIKRLDGSWQLQGGTEDDRLCAREWASLFLHEAVLPVC